MSSSDSGVDYSYVLNPERLKRRLAIRIVVALSAAGTWLLHTVVERPVLAWRDRYLAARTAGAGARVAQAA